MSRDDKFVNCVKNGKYTSVKRYLKCTYWGHFMCNRVVSASIVADDEKMFDLLLGYPTIIDNITNQCIISAIMSDTKHEKAHYIRKIHQLKTFPYDELVDVHLQVSRLKKLYGIRKKMLMN